MASRVAPVQQSHFPKRKAAKSKGYLAFLHRLPCVITGRFGVHACHLSFSAPEYGHYGRGKQTKAPDRWALPMVPEQHAAQHALGDERLFWAQRRANPHFLALVLWGLWSSDGDDAEEECVAVIRSGCYRTAPGSPTDTKAIFAERQRIVARLMEEADLTPCSEDAMVTRSNARLIQADFSYEEAERLLEIEEARANSPNEPKGQSNG